MIFILIKQAEQVRAEPRWGTKDGGLRRRRRIAQTQAGRDHRGEQGGAAAYSGPPKAGDIAERRYCNQTEGPDGGERTRSKRGKKGAALRRRRGVERTAAFEELAFEMDWQLAMSGRFYKIEDVAIDGVSMALTHRSEIASMIARDGGRLESLLATMRQES